MPSLDGYLTLESLHATHVGSFVHRRRRWGYGCYYVRLYDRLDHWDKHMVWAAIVLVLWFPRRNSFRVSFRLSCSTHLPKIPSYAMVAVRYRRRTNRSAILVRSRRRDMVCGVRSWQKSRQD